MDKAAESLRLDPDYASALIAQAGHVGTEGAAAGSVSGVNSAAPKGVSLTDAAVADASAAAVAAQQRWEAVVAAASGEQVSGGDSGVTELSRTESENAVRLGEVGQEADSGPAVWI
jgi:hypothetical protein